MFFFYKNYWIGPSEQNKVLGYSNLILQKHMTRSLLLTHGGPRSTNSLILLALVMIYALKKIFHLDFSNRIKQNMHGLGP
jgi:hypothetical protein